MRIRLPEPICSWIAERAKANYRSMNSEIILALQSVKEKQDRTAKGARRAAGAEQATS